MHKYIISILLLWPFSALAVDPLQSLRDAASGTGLASDKEPTDVIVSIINTILYFVGTLTMVLILWAGFKWLTSAGNTDTIKKSRETIVNAVIGLAIIFASYIIVNFVMEKLINSAGISGGGSEVIIVD